MVQFCIKQYILTCTYYIFTKQFYKPIWIRTVCNKNVIIDNNHNKVAIHHNQDIAWIPFMSNLKPMIKFYFKFYTGDINSSVVHDRGHGYSNSFIPAGVYNFTHTT